MKITAFADPRVAVATLAERDGETLAGLSRFIGRHDGYLDRFVRMGIPKALPVKERGMLAHYLGTDERDLGAPNVPAQTPPPPPRPKLRPRYAWYDARRAA